MGRTSEYHPDDLAAMFPARKPGDRKPEPVPPPGWTEEGIERMLLLDVFKIGGKG